jgi:hypothetical protein
MPHLKDLETRFFPVPDRASTFFAAICIFWEKPERQTSGRRGEVFITLK